MYVQLRIIIARVHDYAPAAIDVMLLFTNFMSGLVDAVPVARYGQKTNRFYFLSLAGFLVGCLNSADTEVKIGAG